MIYKVSYVVAGGKHPGAIINQGYPPQVGEKVQLGESWFEVTDVQDLLPPQGEFAYLHADCKPTDPPESGEEEDS